MSNTIQLRLTIDIEYTPNDENEQYLVSRLETIPGWLSGEGQFTGDSSAEVESWSSKVQRIGKVSMETLSWKNSKEGDSNHG